MNHKFIYNGDHENDSFSYRLYRGMLSTVYISTFTHATIGVYLLEVDGSFDSSWMTKFCTSGMSATSVPE